jgi:hypothetical protein
MSATSSEPMPFISNRDKAILADPAALAAEHLRLACSTRGAVVFVAWVIGLFAAASIIVGIITAVQIVHLNNAINNSGGGNTSNCMSQGSTNPNC